jgi:hypothetical protein
VHFSRAYSWEFDLSLVSHSTFPKNLLDGEHKEQLQWSGQQNQQLANPQIKQLIANQNQLMQAVLQTLQHL